MKFDLIYILSIMMFVICTISLGYTVLRCLKNNFGYKHKIKNKLQRIKALDYKIYLDIKDYVTYEKYDKYYYNVLNAYTKKPSSYRNIFYN